MSGARPLAPVRRLKGRVCVPGDKSVSHRALVIAAAAEGTSRLAGLNPGTDVAATRGALSRLGASFAGEGDGTTVVEGRGWDGLRGEGPLRLDCGNSGTTARLLLGLLAGRRVDAVLTGDASLTARPMDRVVRPLRALGAEIEDGATLPLRVRGAPLTAATLETGVASAQVKGALVLAALQADGTSRIVEPAPTRDHTERLAAAAGAPVERAAGPGSAVVVRGGAAPLRPLALTVPGDPSAAAPLLALACARPGSELAVEGVSLNPTRLGFVRLLRRMGAEIEEALASDGVEPRGRLVARGAELRGVDVDASDVVAAVDEIPLVAVLAAIARGPTTIRGASELRVKESDRLSATAGLLRALGARCEERPDGLAIEGGARLRGARVDACGDHRIAMAASVAAGLADGASTLDGHAWVAVSYPAFFDDLERLAS